ncbi:MAG: helix-turn-helix domain-containing protein [Ruminococcus sp.]|nr:helix-turn-helix domain-containing protein [Ruminococcus sp.]
MRQAKLERELSFDSVVDTIPSRIRKVLKYRKMTQQDLADITTIPIDRIKSYMRKKKAATIPTSALVNIAVALNVSIDYLCGRTEHFSISLDNDIERTLNSVCVLASNKFSNAFRVKVVGEHFQFSTMHPVIKGLILNVLSNPNISDEEIRNLVLSISNNLTEYNNLLLTTEQYMETIHAEFITQMPLSFDEAVELDVVSDYAYKVEELEAEWMNLSDDERKKWSRLSDEEKGKLYPLSVSQKKEKLK